MNCKAIEELIIKTLSNISKDKKGYTVDEIIERGAVSIHAHRIRKRLYKLLKQGIVEKNTNNTFKLSEKYFPITGVLRLNRAGNGFVASSDYPDGIFIPASYLNSALHGDRVAVTLLPPNHYSKYATVGMINAVIARENDEIVGTVKLIGNKKHVLIPINPSYQEWFFIYDIKNAAPCDRVVAKFHDDEQPLRGVDIVKIIGSAEDPLLDTISVIRSYGLRTEFPKAIIAEAEEISQMANDCTDREDLRDELIITIDPENARDFDDALSVKHFPDGRRILGVHIADVSHFVRKNSLIDKEALKRGTSVYFPDNVLPMLPEQLSNNICSLKPNVDRLTFSVFLEYDPDGYLIKHRFSKSIIRSRQRLTYEQVMKVINGDGHSQISVPVRNLILALHKLAMQLRNERFKRNALNIDLPEIEVKVNNKGIVTEIKTSFQDASHQLVEECMIAANEAVASELYQHSIPLISRYHAAPLNSDIEKLQKHLHTIGIFPGNLKDPNKLAKFLLSLGNDLTSYHIKLSVLKSMRRAIYSATDHGHFGLAKEHYCHFTSPIRRYPDLIVHRQLTSLLERDNSRLDYFYKRNELINLAEHCSQCEQTAADAERNADEIKIYRFIEKMLEKGEHPIFDGVIMAVTANGIFVEMPFFQLEGYIPRYCDKNSLFSYNPRRHLLKVGKVVYKAGQHIKVNVVAVDTDRRRITLSLGQ